MKQQLTPILIPVIANYVLSPIVIYGENFTSSILKRKTKNLVELHCKTRYPRK
ncbi:hypothetical protein [Empedobacter sedimenti]|uniref:hypothetical protein n=1 Tax=Empedobacter sedimenti TaxID=3042610 RepID=UPI0024A74F7F|nr:hypothetical protein [Empedobacter sedimenti]